MPKYYKYTSKYNPYTFQEMWEPALVATQAHQQYATQLAAQEASAASLQNYLDPNSPEDAEMYNQYTNYINGIRNVSKQLSTKGMSSSTFNDVLGLSTQYATTIKPIEDLVTVKKETISGANKLLSEHPDYVLSRDTDPRTMSLSSFRYGVPKLDFISGEKVKQDVAQLAALYSKSISSIEAIKDPNLINKFQDVIKKTTGLTYEQFKEQLDNSESPLNEIADLVLRNNGITGNNLLPEDYIKIAGFAEAGLYGAIGTTDLSPTTSEWYLNQKYNMDMAEHRAKMQNYADQHKAHEAAAKKAQQEALNSGLTFQYSTDLDFTQNKDNENYNNVKKIFENHNLYMSDYKPTNTFFGFPYGQGQNFYEAQKPFTKEELEQIDSFIPGFSKMSLQEQKNIAKTFKESGNILKNFTNVELPYLSVNGKDLSDFAKSTQSILGNSKVINEKNKEVDTKDMFDNKGNTSKFNISVDLIGKRFKVTTDKGDFYINPENMGFSQGIKSSIYDVMNSDLAEEFRKNPRSEVFNEQYVIEDPTTGRPIVRTYGMDLSESIKLLLETFKNQYGTLINY